MIFPIEQILNRVTNGDEIAFDQLYSHFSVPAYEFCMSLLKDHEDAECAMKQTFDRIWAERNTLYTHSDFNSYLFNVLKNVVFENLVLYSQQPIMGQYMSRMENLYKS